MSLELYSMLRIQLQFLKLISLHYLVKSEDANQIPGSGANPLHIFGGFTITDSNGNFTINGTMLEPVAPGYASIVIETIQSGYVGNDGIDLGVFVNVTDDSNITHEFPAQPNQANFGCWCNYCSIRSVIV